MDAEPISLNLKEHQTNTCDWSKKDLARNLHEWTERFICESKLKTSVPVLMLDRLRWSTCGHFRRGRNGFGLINEIGINERHITREEYWDTLATLLHELLHAEQEVAGTPGKGNYHNREFRNRAESLGLCVDSWGHTFIMPAPSPFLALLEEYGVDVPRIDESAPVHPVSGTGNSKLKLWVCSCTPAPVRVRVAVADFRAVCLKCNQMFVRKG